MTHIHRPLAINSLIAVNVVVGLAGAVSGLLMLIDPSGALLGLSPDLLAEAPVHDYLLPGLVLLYVLGLLPLAAARGLYTNENWSLPLSLTIGIILAGWIIMQILFVGFTAPHHPVLGGAAILMIVLATRRSSWRYALR